MKGSIICFLFLALFFICPSCKDHLGAEVGTGIQPDEDKILARTDTFHLQTTNVFPKKIYNRPDSLLLGAFDDKKFGELTADILTQFDAPFSDKVENRYPEGAQVDSVILVLWYSSWFGASKSLMNVSAYEMNKGKALDYHTYYPSDINPDDYVDLNAEHALVGEQTLTARPESNGVKANRVTMKLTDHLRDKLFDLSKNYTEQADFLDAFKGLYITTDLGDATMLNVRTIEMMLYYNYKQNVEGKDTLIRNNVLFPSNSLVTRVNRFQHPNADKIEEFLSKDENLKYNFISTPANVYPKVTIPVRRMIMDMKNSIGEMRLTLSAASLRVEAVDIEREPLSLLPPSEILLISEKGAESYFKTATIDSLYLASYNPRDSAYTINIVRLLSQEIKQAEDKEGVIDPLKLSEELSMLLMPTNALYQIDPRHNTRRLIGVEPLIQMRGVSIRSGKDPERPMKVNLVYNGF